MYCFIIYYFDNLTRNIPVALFLSGADARDFVDSIQKEYIHRLYICKWELN